jgi:penicillin-binding protein activator
MLDPATPIPTMPRHSRIIPAALVLVALAACSSPKVTRIQPNTAADLSGEWNSIDSKQVADEMIKDAMTLPWVARYMQAHQGASPTVKMGNVVNKSTEHINTRTFIQDMANAFTRSGTIQVAMSAEDMNQVRAERNDQQSNASADTRAKQQAEQGADFLLTGTIETINDREGGREVKYYQVDLKITNTQTGILAWTGQKKIAKYINRNRIGK